jgi:phage tail-like protein
MGVNIPSWLYERIPDTTRVRDELAVVPPPDVPLEWGVPNAPYFYTDGWDYTVFEGIEGIWLDFYPFGLSQDEIRNRIVGRELLMYSTREFVGNVIGYSPPYTADNADHRLYLDRRPVGDFEETLAQSERAVCFQERPPLKQLLTLLGSGLQASSNEVDQLVTLVDVDACPAAYLPLLGQMLGFEFPYDLPEVQQRNFVRSAVSLYRVRGTRKALQVVVTRFMGEQFRLEILDEDYIAKTYSLQVTAEEQDAVLNTAFESKIVYLINLYSPAGLIPSLVVVYFLTEEAEAEVLLANDTTHVTTELNSCRASAGFRASKDSRCDYLSERVLTI